ncbi:DNA polymerase III sliding clamp beta [Gordonia phage Amore2]|uniref:Putative DNA polymerase III beta subunit n=1 Tax=Gordonia phage GMA7 TaxID=1647286 RepID=A0A0K0N6C8_9CAUD|nr:DNA polymerase processivity factor [Gordonia phage GMA7]AKJ72484.1 putative DNA polymerase III beta subunit [Gordonia phage GMA7]QSL99697.1 DNA polymerase III sliding clamp beta [Gordonia phage Austin]USH44873.1 DNA polymerase III sliding clamp beta [Gordonia phage Amore2]
MATVIEFNNATLADAIKRANTVAPTRGREFDMFKGFVFDINPDEEFVTLRATNGELYYTEYLYPVNMEVDQAVSWRVSSVSTPGIISNLSVKGNIKMKDEGGKIRMTSGRMKATTPLIRGGEYPDIEHFLYEPENMIQMTGLGARMDLVGWATTNDGMPPRCGVYMDEDYLCATNGIALVRVPNEYKFKDGRENVVIPYQLVAPILRTLEEVEVGVIGNHLVMSPTEDILIKCTMFDPGFDPVNRVMEKEYEASISFNRDEVVNALNRVSKVGRADRQIALDVFIVGEMMTLAIRDRDSSEEIEESILLIEDAPHDELVRYIFSIEFFTEAISKSPTKELTMFYNPSKPVSVVKVQAVGGYEAAIMPRIDMKEIKKDGN